jgi:hypothetical protein
MMVTTIASQTLSPRPSSAEPVCHPTATLSCMVDQNPRKPLTVHVRREGGRGVRSRLFHAEGRWPSRFGSTGTSSLRDIAAMRCRTVFSDMASSWAAAKGFNAVRGRSSGKGRRRLGSARSYMEYGVCQLPPRGVLRDAYIHRIRSDECEPLLITSRLWPVAAGRRRLTSTAIHRVCAST